MRATQIYLALLLSPYFSLPVPRCLHPVLGLLLKLQSGHTPPQLSTIFTAIPTPSDNQKGFCRLNNPGDLRITQLSYDWPVRHQQKAPLLLLVLME